MSLVIQIVKVVQINNVYHAKLVIILKKAIVNNVMQIVYLVMLHHVMNANHNIM